MQVITTVVFLFVFANSLLVKAQDCGFVDNPDVIFDIGTVLETTEPGTLLWTHPIYNVLRSTAVNTPHFYYMTGLRYVTRYEYEAADIFPNFVDTERAHYLERNVTFTCNDLGTHSYYFRLRVVDENTQAPEFNNPEYSIAATVPWPIDAPINGPTMIIAMDNDFEPQHANLYFGLSNSNFRIQAESLSTEPYPDVYYYKVDVYYSRGDVAPNVYQTILTVDDGLHSQSVPLVITVTEAA